MFFIRLTFLNLCTFQNIFGFPSAFSITILRYFRLKSTYCSRFLREDFYQTFHRPVFSMLWKPCNPLFSFIRKTSKPSLKTCSSVSLRKMASVTTTSPELIHGRHPYLPGDFRMPHAPAPATAPIVSSSTCSPPGSVVMRPPPPPPPKMIHRLQDIKHERIHHEEPSSSIPDLGKSYLN